MKDKAGPTLERQIRMQTKALKQVQEAYDESKIPTIHKLVKVF